MRIERAQIGAFGHFRDFDSGPEPLAGLVAILGNNEAGKSTLFHFLTTMLYGFRPASRENNPYLPWGGLDASGSVRIRLDGGKCAEVERHLRSQPSGRLTSDGVADELRNRAIPWVDHVPAAVFGQVYAITLGDLIGLDAETWARIQDRLLGAMGASDLLPPRAVADDLEQEAGAIWRPHKRGNQRVRDIQEDIRNLRVRRREATEVDHGLRQVVADLEETKRSLAVAREEREHQRVVVERVQRLAPIRSQLARISTLRQEGGDAARLVSLPASPGTVMKELTDKRAELIARADQLTNEVAEPRAVVAAADDGVRRIVERADEVRAFLAGATGNAADRARIESLQSELLENERQLDDIGAAMLATPWREVPQSALATLSLEEIRDAVKEARIAGDDRRVLEIASSQSLENLSAPPGIWPGASTALFGIALLVVGWMWGPSALIALGAAAAAIGATLLLQARRADIRSPSDAVRRDLDVATRRESAARERLRVLIRDVPLSPACIEESGDSLVTGLERVRSLLRDHERRQTELRASVERVARLDRDATVLASTLGRDPGLGTENLVQLFDKELRRAERLSDAVEHAERELKRIERDQSRLAGEISVTETQQSELSSRLVELGGGDLERGLANADTALKAHSRADQLQAELERTHPDLHTSQQQIAEAEAGGETWTVSDADLARRRATIERLTEEIEAAVARVEALDHEIKHMGGLETVDSVDGELAALTESAAQLIRERDRRWVMAQLLRESDRRFREEHQPDLVRRASGYLKHLTGGRYDRIVVDETTDGDIFHVTGPGLTRPVPLTRPISTGTLEQAYLSLRLAIVDHLDQGGERLPLFIDEAFMNWDPERRERGLNVLGSVARVRQVFVFTCHPEVVGSLETVGAQVLELQPAE